MCFCSCYERLYEVLNACLWLNELVLALWLTCDLGTRFSLFKLVFVTCCYKVCSDVSLLAPYLCIIISCHSFTNRFYDVTAITIWALNTLLFSFLLWMNQISINLSAMLVECPSVCIGVCVCVCVAGDYSNSRTFMVSYGFAVDSMSVCLRRRNIWGYADLLSTKHLSGASVL